MLLAAVGFNAPPHCPSAYCKTAPLLDRVVQSLVRVRQRVEPIPRHVPFHALAVFLFNTAIAYVLTSRAEKENGLSPAKRIKYQ